LGGTYTESLITVQKNNFFLDCQGVTLNGSIWFKDCIDVGADFTGSEVISTSSAPTLRFSGTVTGGKFTQSTNAVNVCTGNDANLISCEFVATGTAYGVSLIDSKVLLSTVKTDGGVNVNNNGCVYRCVDSIFSLCIFEDTGTGRNCYNTKEFNTFYNCFFKSDGVCIKGESNIGLKGKFVGCEMESLSNYCVDMAGNSNKLAFYKCKLIGSTDTFDLSDLSSSVSARTGFTPITTILDNCEMFAGTGDIFNEPTSYDAADTGVTLVKYCTYNKDFTASIPSKLIEEYVINTGATGTNTGLQNI